MEYVPLTREEFARASEASLADRRYRGEIMTYRENGWMMREYPGQRVERLCLANEFDPEKYPLPPMTEEELARRKALGIKSKYE